MIDYNLQLRHAMQKLVAEVLQSVAETGELPGKNHFYISFRTQEKGVDIPSQLRAQFPEEMTIVLQHWFDNLTVLDDRFGVTLSFGGQAQNLVIPFEALIAFADPHAQFSLRFDAQTEPQGSEQPDDHESDAEEDVSAIAPIDETSNEKRDRKENVIILDAFRKDS